MEYKLHNGSGGLCCKGCSRQDKKLNTYDWLADIPGNAEESDMVEVQFKNTRKGYFRNSNKIKLEKGDVVAVEAAPGHDIGVVTLTGRLVPLQMKKANFKADTEIKRVYRKAKPVDMEKFNEAKAKEHATMIRARQIALNLNLDMKIGDVEYQGDGNKAIFYYIADERVDFRQLIKVLAEAFRVRIEMKQIGARQEAGRIGGIGPCGRELCCATWMTSFVSVSTSAARFQDISLNPQKLAGQCAKLKCCLNYEVDCYVEAQKRLPSREIELETKDGTFYFFKADILSNQVSYSTDKNFPANLVTISGKRAFEVISMNKKGMKPDSLLEEEKKPEPRKPVDLLEQESVTRFDRSRNNKEGGNNANRNNKKKKTIITETARNSKQKAAIVRNNLNGKMKTARNSQKTATEGKETTAREITITTTGTEDRTKDGTTKTDVRKEDQIRNVHKDRNGRIRNVRSNKTVNANSKDRNVKNVVPTTSVLLGRKEIRIRRNSQLMKSLLKNSILSLFSACLLTACNEHTVYHSYQSLPNKGWGKSDTLSFQIPITDSVPTTLRLFAEVRNSIEYPYHDLHLFISQNLQDSTVWRTDTIAFCLADSTGRWTGHGWGSIYQSETFITSVRPLHPANYTIKIMSGMKDEKLQGLSDVGIRIEKQ